jgi:DNA modification methylase
MKKSGEIKSEHRNNNILEILSKLQSVPQSETTKFTHGIHPYPAKFIPQIPKLIIESFSNERHKVLDPFCGSGTTLLEAKLAGRDAVGFDINPIGVLMSRVKTYPLGESELALVEKFMKTIDKKISAKDYSHVWIPDIPRIDHWFNKEVQMALGLIAEEIRKITILPVRRFLSLCFSAIIVSVSNQESETRFAAKKNNVNADKVFRQFNNKVTNVLSALAEVDKVKKAQNTVVDVYLEDTRNMTRYIREKSIDLVITSPPYLNSFDYYLYHKFRMYWLSFDKDPNEMLHVSEVQNKEIGSRYEFSGPNGENISEFKKNMFDCLMEIRRITKPGKMIFFLVGDSILKGEFISMDKFYESLGEEAGLRLMTKISYPMKNISRSFVSQNTNNIHLNKKMQHILIFQNVSLHKDVEELVEYVPTMKVDEIPKKVPKGSKIVITSNHVTSYTHGLAKYPAKFIPHIPRWAINTYSKKGDLILDPFVGCGTTLVEASLLGRNSVGIDINPVGVLYSKVKTTPLSPIKLNAYLQKIVERYNTKPIANIIEFPFRDFWFDKKIMAQLLTLKLCIEKIPEEDYRDYFNVIFATIIKPCSYLDESQLKVERSHSKLVNGVENPMELFIMRAKKHAENMNQLYTYPEKLGDATAVVGTATSLPKIVILNNKKTNLRNVDLIVTSPPYINAMNYPMYNRYELLLLELIKSQNYISHQEEYLGTERVYSKDYKVFSQFTYKMHKYESLNKKLKEVYSKEPKRAYIAKRYFEGMVKSFEECYRVLKKGGKFIYVCGANTIKGVDLQTAEILSVIAKDVGFKLLTAFEYQIRNHRFKVTRHATGKKITVDYVYVFEKV